MIHKPLAQQGGRQVHQQGAREANHVTGLTGMGPQQPLLQRTAAGGANRASRGTGPVGGGPRQVGPHQQGPSVMNRTVAASTAAPAGQAATRQPETRSTNVDFAGMCKSMFRYAQISHAMSNWEVVPKGIESGLKRFVSNIKPPMPNGELSSRLTALTVDFGERVREAVGTHLIECKLQVEQRMMMLDRTDVEQASRIVCRQLDTKLGKKLSRERRDDLLKSAIGMLGLGRDHLDEADEEEGMEDDVMNASTWPPPGSVQQTEVEDGGVTVGVTGGDQTSGSGLVGSVQAAQSKVILGVMACGGTDGRSPNKKRKTEVVAQVSDSQVDLFSQTQTQGSSDIQPGQQTAVLTTSREGDGLTGVPGGLTGVLGITSNETTNVTSTTAARNQVINDAFAITFDCVIDNDVSVMNTAADNYDVKEVSTEANITVNKPVDDDIDQYASPNDNVTLYDKTDLTRLFIPAHCNILVLGDSNLRLITGLPAKYEVVVIPGARFAHITEAVNALQTSTAVEHIVVAAGINHRDRDYNKETLPAARTLADTLRRRGLTAHFLGVSYNNKLAPGLKANLDHINTSARSEYKERFIPPVPSDKVSTGPDGIHHKQYTVNAIRDSILAHFMSLN